MMDTYYKAVRLDRTSHYDGKTKWRKGVVICVDKPDPPSNGPCGRGIHCSPTLLDAVGWQAGPSRYYRVEPLDVIAGDETKIRCTAVKVLNELTKAEQDEIAGFHLYEANHPVCPFHREPRNVSDRWIEDRICQWVLVHDSVRDSVRDSVWHSVWGSAGGSAGTSVWDSVGDSIRDSVRVSVGVSIGTSIRDSVWHSVWGSVDAYIGGLFPNITEWKRVEHLGPTPWKPLCDLWYAGYVPSFDGKIWRVHCGPRAEVRMELDFSRDGG